MTDPVDRDLLPDGSTGFSAPSRAPKHRELGTDGRGDWWEHLMPHDWLRGAGLGGMVYSFREAARTLTEDALGQRPHDATFAPIAFMWRHTIELALKHGLGVLSRWPDEPALTGDEQRAIGEHDLRKLWDLWRERQLRVHPEWGPAKDVTKAEKMLRQLAALEVDPSAFRYGQNISGKLFEFPERVNLAEFTKALDLIVSVVIYLEDELDSIRSNMPDEREFYDPNDYM